MRTKHAIFVGRLSHLTEEYMVVQGEQEEANVIRRPLPRTCKEL